MLGKLLKYEIKSTSRIFLLLYPAIILLAVINKVTNIAFQNVRSEYIMLPQSLFGMMYGILVVAVCVITLIMIIQRFYKNLIGQEGYLMYTLPVSSTSLILSKLITAVMWTAASVLVIFSSIFIISYEKGMFAEIISENQKAADWLTSNGINTTVMMIIIIALVVFALLFVIMTIYTSMSIGQLANKNKLLFSVVAYFVISIVNQVVGVLILLVSMMHFDGQNVEKSMRIAEDIADSPFGVNSEATRTLVTETYKVFEMMGVIFIAYFAVAVVGMFIASKYLLSKKLNLE